MEAGPAPMDISASRKGPITTKDRKLKSKLKRNADLAESAAKRAARAELLLPTDAGYLVAEGMEKTFKFTQDQIVEHVDEAAARKVFSLDLNFGPYHCDYSRNTKALALAGRQGHLAVLDWQTARLRCEVQVKETVRDVCFLHNDTLFAVAQRRHVYVYDNQGIEVHRMANHVDPQHLTYLPYHFLLVSLGRSGYLKYHDTSTGQLVSELRTHSARCPSMTQNPWNAIVHVGHNNGVVTLWSPNMTQPLVRMLCHATAVSSVGVYQTGNYMVTTGLDCSMKLWDLRKYQVVDTYSTDSPASTISISQRGLVAVGCGPRAVVWKDMAQSKQTSPYLKHMIAGSVISSAKFVPYDDVLGLAHHQGFASILVPGSGEPNFDSFAANPYETQKQRRETEVAQLLDKLPATTISMDPGVVATVDRTPAATLDAERRAERMKIHAAAEAAKKPKNRMKGRNRATRRQAVKQQNVIDQKKLELKEKSSQAERGREVTRAEMPPEAPSVLDRFRIR